jgi:hypothetical protein
MAKIKIGPQTVQVDDSFLQLPPDQQQAVVDEIAASMGNEILPRAAAAPQPSGEGDVTAPNVFKAGLRGIPILGAGMNQAAAAIDAATQPLFGSMSGSQAPTFGERRAANLQANQANEKAFREESPIASTASEVAGGVGALLPLAATKVGAKLLGLSGSTLPQMVRQGAMSGAGINAADALARGDDLTTAAGVGGVTGAAVPMLGAAAGAGARAVKRMMAPAPALAQAVEQTVDVAGRPVRMSQSQMSGDAAQSAEEQIAARTGAGQPIAQEWRAAQQADMQGADAAVREGIDPQSAIAAAMRGEAPPRVPPSAAADAVQTELTQAAGQRAAATTAAQQAAAAEGDAIALAAGGGRQVADAPFTAGEILASGFNRAATQARNARTAAYNAARDADIEITPPALDRVDAAVRNRLNEGERVRLNDRTPMANDAIETIRNGFGQTDRLRPPEPGAGAPRPNVTGTDIDELRKDLIALQRQANNAARTSGDNTDARAVQRIISAYDDVVEQAVEAGTVRGDGREFLRLLGEARAAHRAMKQAFSSRGPNDEVGKIVEKIVLRDVDQRATPDWIAEKAFGPEGNPGGQTATRVARRIREQFGEQSDEWAAYRQGLLAHITETAPGTAPRTPEQIAERMMEFDNGRGRQLAREAFSPDELQRLQAHAGQVRATQPAGRPTDPVERAVQRITGEDGNPPATVNAIVNMLYGSKGMGNTSLSVPLAQRLKRELSPESWAKVKLGLYSELTEVPEGMITRKEQALSQQLHNFLNGDGKQLAEVVFTERERGLIGQIAGAYRRMIPVEGTTNPSGTAPMLQKIAAKAQSVLLPLLGFSHGGMVGAGLGVAGQRVLESVVEKRAAKDAVRRFYGEQPPSQVPSRGPQSRMPDLIARGATPALTN